MDFSIGIGLTNNCDLNCPHCYRDQTQISNITLEEIQILCKSLPINAMGMGTGENILNPEFIQILDFLAQQDFKLSIASNGLTLTSLPDKYLQIFNDVEVSVDFPTKREQDQFRCEGNWDLTHKVIDRCKDLGIEMTILTTMMSNNYDKMDKMVEHARLYNLNLRVSAFQSVNTNKFHMDYNQFWEGYRLLLSSSKLVSCSEPVVRSVLSLDNVYSPCGHKSIRINPQGQVIPCVYWKGFNDDISVPKITDLIQLRENILESHYFKLIRELPKAASDCPCQGGCASRRVLNGSLDAHDEYCPWVRNDKVDLKWEQADSSNLVRVNNNCTTIVK
ncbi:MAG: radical SAM protein [Promethearchaeota archaeon]